MAALIGCLAVGACAVLPAMGADSWREEVLLHDGQTIVVERSQSYGGTGVIGQPPPVKELSIAFNMPGTGQRITWKSGYSEDISRNDFKPAALHVLDGTPYLVAIPNLCLSYNKWGRPNPPYVFFKYENSNWKRIPLEEFPTAFTTINMVVNNAGEADLLKGRELVAAHQIRKLNSELTQPEYREILRTPSSSAFRSCTPMLFAKGSGWLGLDWFTDQPNLQSCLNFCNSKKFSIDVCPCKQIFEAK